MNDDIFSLFGAPPAPVVPVQSPQRNAMKAASSLSTSASSSTLSLDASIPLAFFVSCSDLHLPSVQTTAQNMLRGAISALGGTAKSAKPPECMIQVDVKNPQRVTLINSLVTEKVRSRNPAFTVGIHIVEETLPIPSDAVVCFQVIMTEEGGPNGKPVATAELTWTNLRQNYNSGASVVYLPLQCPYTDAGVLTLRFSRTSPIAHTLLATQNQVMLSYAFPNANPSQLPTLVTEEMAEVGPSVQLPLIFLRQCRRELEGAYHLWRVRYNNAKKRLKHFADADEAMQSGCDVFKIGVLQARQLHPMQSLRKIPSKPLMSPKSFKKQLPIDFEPVGVHPFAVVLFNETTAPRANLSATPWQVVGKTNTEYEKTAPCWGTNEHESLCPHGSPSLTSFVSTGLHAKVEKGRFVWYRPSRSQQLSGAIQIDVCSENEFDSHQPPTVLGSVTLVLEDLRPLMCPDEESVVPNALALHSANWFPIVHQQSGQVVGEVQLELHVRLTSAQFVLESEQGTHFQKKAKADETPLFRLATTTMDRALRETMHIPNDQETYSIQFLHAHVKELGSHVKELDAMIRKAESRMASRSWFKGSTDKKKRDLQAFTTNLHVAYLRKFNWPASNSPRPSSQPSQCDLLGLDKLSMDDNTTTSPLDENRAIATYAIVTCGAPTAHALPDEGLMELEDKLVKTHKDIALMANGMKNLNHGRVMVEGGNILSERPVLVPATEEDDSVEVEEEEEEDDKTKKKSKGKKSIFTKLTRQGTETNGWTIGQHRERFESIKYQYYFRKSVCVSQSVSTLVTSFLAMLELHSNNPTVVSQWAQIGFLIGWESLISSQGKEWRMLSDAWVAIKCLERYSFLLDHTTSEIVLEERSGDHEGYIIRIPTKTEYNLGLISVTPVLFTQGINEMQSLANMVGSSGVELQSTINNASFKSLQLYHSKYLKMNVEPDSTAAHLLLDPLMAVVQSENAASKNTRILLEASDVVRRLNGGRVTYCKSGKDRTAMSVTLEQARLLFKRVSGVNPLHLLGATEQLNISADELNAANLMREFGIRIKIAKKNVGRFKYSFNALQRKMLPDIYRPPVSTIQDMVTSVTARDS
ncbi:unnamed protein product [Aphanomyces euteiches]